MKNKSLTHNILYIKKRSLKNLFLLKNQTMQAQVDTLSAFSDVYVIVFLAFLLIF